MKSHRYGLEIVNDMEGASEKFDELCNVLGNITDVDLINTYQTFNSGKSLAKTINKLIKDRLTYLGWENESQIFKDSALNATTRDWRLDFVSPPYFSVEVAFNHASATTVNLMKPVLASELNHVEKKFQTNFGVIITATRAMKRIGGFDNAIGTFEGYCEQCKPLMNQLTIPMIIIGIEPPETFELIHRKKGNTTKGFIKLDSGRELKIGDYINEHGEVVSSLLLENEKK